MSRADISAHTFVSEAKAAPGYYMANLIIKLVNGYFLLADDQSHVDCQDQVSALCSNQQAWTRRSILEVAP